MPKGPTIRTLEIAKAKGTQEEIASRFGVNQPRVAHIQQRWSIRPNTYIVGDCLKVIPRMIKLGIKVNCVITSPPYNLGLTPRSGATNWQSNTLAQEGYEAHLDNMARKDYVKWQRQVIEQCLTLVGSEGVVFWQHKPVVRDGVTTMQQDIWDGLPLRQMIIWDRGSSNNHDTSLIPPTYEFVAVLAPKTWKLPPDAYQASRTWGAVWRIPPEFNPHPAPFPYELVRRLMTFSRGAVLDPFAGSGTVGKVAIDMGWPYYLIDISRQYKDMFEIK